MSVESGRWSLQLDESTTTNTSDRLGDGSAARYRRLRRFVEALDVEDDRLDHALMGLLLSAESLRDEMQAYEQQASVLLRLAQSGHFVRQLQRLNRVVDAVVAAFGMEEPTAASNWGKTMEEERAERVERYDRLLAEFRCDLKPSGDETEERPLLLVDVETKEQQQEVLTLLKFAVDTYDDVLTPREAEATVKAFQLVAQRCNVVVMALPSWFAAPFEFGATFGLSRWGNDLFEPGHEDQTRIIKLANVWSRLNHPHMAKFLGACHVGVRVFIAHEKLRPLRGYVADLAEEKRSPAEGKQKVWRRMYEVVLSLQYLHERGLACERLDVDAVLLAQFEDKAVLLGVGLTAIGSSGSLDAGGDQEAQQAEGDAISDTQALGAVILNVLKMLSPPVDAGESNAFLDALENRTSSTEPGESVAFHQQIAKESQSEEGCRFDSIPAVRPEFVSQEEWAVLKLIRGVRATSSGDLLQVLIAMQEIAGLRQDQPNHRRVVDQAFEATSGTIDIGQLVVPMLGNKTVSSALAQLKHLFASNRLALDVYARLEDVSTQLQSLIELKGISEGSSKAALVDFLVLLVRTHQISYSKAGRDSVGSSRFASYLSSISGSITPSQDLTAVFSLHANIDHLLQHHDLDDSSAVHHWKPSCSAITLAHQVAYREDLIHLWSATSQPDGCVGFLGSQLDADDQEAVEALLAFELGHRLDSLGSASLSLQRALQTKLPRWFLPRSEVVFKFDAGELGRGSFGAVLFGKWFDTPVVVKRVFIDADNRQRVRDQFRREADVWFPLNHINVVKLYGACHVGDPFFICEYASGGDLDAYLQREGREPYRMWYCLLNAALGLQYLHDNGIVHGDLKANNILVGSDNVVKLADFGLSTSTRDAQDSGGALGAYRWKAPECLAGESATFASDVFSFAMVMVEIMTGVVPWGGVDDPVVKALVVRGDSLKKPPEIDNPEWRLIQRMCCRDPTKRTTIDAVVVHLSSLIESLAMPQLWPSIHGDIALKSFQNHVGSRGGALLSLLTLASSRNKKLAKLSSDRLRAVHIGRDTPSDKREIDAIINILFTGSEVEKEWAAGALTTLTWENPMNKSRVAAGGAIPLLVALLRDGSDVHKEKAAGALTNMALGADNQVEIAAAGAIELLVVLVRGGTDVQKEMSAGALANLATSQEIKVRIATSGVLDALVALARDGAEEQKVNAATAFWNLARNSEANAELISAAGAISPLVEMVRSGTKAQRQRAASALKNLADESEKNRVAVAEAGGIGPLVVLARDGSNQEKDQAVGALWCLSTNNRENQAAIIADGGVSALVALTQDGTNIQKEKAAGALAMLAENAEGKARIVEADGITPLVVLVREGIDDEQEIAANALGNLSLIPETSALIGAAGAIAPLVLLAREGTVSQKIAATSALWCLSVYNADNRVAIVAAGGAVELVALVRSGHDFNKYLAAGALGTLAADSKPIQASIAAEGGVDVLVELVRSGSDGQKQQAASALRHLSKDNAENKARIEAAGGIGPLLAMMRDGTPARKEVAFEIVASLTESTNNPAAIVRAGGVTPLAVLVRSGTREQQDRAASALVTLSSSMDLTESVVAARALAAFARGGTFQQRLVVLRTLLVLLPRVLALWWRRWRWP